MMQPQEDCFYKLESGGAVGDDSGTTTQHSGFCNYY